jgi:hypothetical protein
VTVGGEVVVEGRPQERGEKAGVFTHPQKRKNTHQQHLSPDNCWAKKTLHGTLSKCDQSFIACRTHPPHTHTHRQKVAGLIGLERSYKTQNSGHQFTAISDHGGVFGLSSVAALPRSPSIGFFFSWRRASDSYS